MRFIGVSDAHTDDVATLSGANVRRDVNSTMTASPANLKTKTSSPAERQVVDKIYQNIPKYSSSNCGVWRKLNEYPILLRWFLASQKSCSLS